MAEGPEPQASLEPGPAVATPDGPFRTLLVRVWRSASQRVMALTTLGMVLGLLVDMLTAARLGAGPRSDSLILALTLPVLLDTILREGTKFSLIAFFLERRNAMDEPAFHRFVSGATNLALVTGALLAAVLLLGAPLIIGIMGPGLAPATRTEAIILLRLLAFMVLFAPGATMLAVYLNSQRVFLPVALRTAIAPAIVVVVFLLAWDSTAIARWIALGYVAGFSSYFVTLLLNARRIGHHHTWNAWLDAGDRRGLWEAGSLPTLGFGVRQGVRLVERALASLGPAGSVAAYYFAYRGFSACQTIVGTSLATTGLPKMAEFDLAGERRKLARIIRRNLVRALALSIPVAIVMILFRTRIVELVDGRGAFTPDAVRRSASFLLWFGIAIPFSACLPVLQAGLYAIRAYALLLRNMVAIGLLNIALAVILFQRMELQGVALAVVLSAATAVVNLVYLLNRTGVMVRSPAVAR